MIRFLLSILKPKRILGLLLGVFAIWWLYNGPEFFSKDQSNVAKSICDEYVSKNPELSDFIAEQRIRYGEFNTAVSFQSIKGESLNPEALQQGIESRTRLLALCDRAKTGDELLLWSHGTALDALDELPQEANDYLTRLEDATKDEDYWSLVRDDPVALTSELLRNDKVLRADYRKNREWYISMVQILASMLELKDDANSPDSEITTVNLDDLLTLPSDSKPYLIQLLPKPEEAEFEACIYFETFRQFGEVIALAASKGVPPKELVEVSVLNRDELLSREEEASGQTIGNPPLIASRLVELHRNRPDVWIAAQRDSYVLAFDRLVPGSSQKVLQKYPDLGVASFVVSQYSDLATQATEIINQYGDLGMAVLDQYESSETFRKLLARGDIDYRIAMVAVLKADEGLQAVLRNPADIDKWVGQDGKPTAPEWWTNVPIVGSVANVARNYATGRSSDWSEIGWAVWDVADVGLMVVSFGTTKIATEAAKQTAKGVGKSAAKKLTVAGLKRSGSAVAKPTALARIISVAKTSRVGQVIQWTSRATIRSAGAAKSLASQAVSASGKVYRAAKSIPPNVRRSVARGLLAVSLFVRAPDQLRALTKSLNEKVITWGKDLIEAIPAALNSALSEVMAQMKNMMNGDFSKVIHFLILVAVGLTALMFLLDVNPRGAYARFGQLSGNRSSKSSRQTRKRN
jgi:hypothetical protein